MQNVLALHKPPHGSLLSSSPRGKAPPCLCDNHFLGLYQFDHLDIAGPHGSASSSLSLLQADLKFPTSVLYPQAPHLQAQTGLKCWAHTSLVSFQRDVLISRLSRYDSSTLAGMLYGMSGRYPPLLFLILLLLKCPF